MIFEGLIVDDPISKYLLEKVNTLEKALLVYLENDHMNAHGRSEAFKILGKERDGSDEE